jgi:hypothetical protein
MSCEFFKAYPTDRDGPVVELNVRHDGVVDVPAEVRRDGGEVRVAIFAPTGGVAWDYAVDEWLAAIKRATELLDGDASC